MGPTLAPPNSWGVFHVSEKPRCATTDDLFKATPGSTGLELSPTAGYVLTPEMGVQAVPMGVYGPLPKNTVGLILGRSSTFLKGFQIHPGVIDQDYPENLKFLLESLKIL
jgi:dUTPase